MAVYQISRIQIRRGKANSGTGIPQLASGEMAWAVDTQELYIGNGAVSEGSPAVGNTRLLTQKDLTSTGNLIGLIQYVYKSSDPTITTGVSANNPVSRAIQARLDDNVSVVDFGTAGDGVTDDTAALQRAINELFLNPSNYAHTDTAGGTSTRVLLRMPAGIFVTTSTIYIPSYASLVGAGVDKTVIYYNPVSTLTGSINIATAVLQTTSAAANMLGATVSGNGVATGTTVIAVTPGVSLTLSGNASATETAQTYTITLAGPAIQFVNDTSTIGNPSTISSTLGTNQPRNIEISDLTVHTPTGQNTCLQLDAAYNCLIDNVYLKGDWTVPASPNPLSTGILMQAFSSIVTCERNLFRNVSFNGFYYAVFAKQDILNNVFVDCHVKEARQGFSLGAGSNGSTVGQQYGPRQTQIVRCKFYNVKQHAVYLERGEYNTVSDSKLANVGNNGAGNTGAQYPQIYFNTYGNDATNTQSDRADDLVVSNIGTPYVPEVSGHGTYQSYGTRQIILSQTASPVIAFRLPVSTDQYGTPAGSVAYEIEYFYKSSSNSFTRSGTIYVTADVSHAQIQLSDDFNFAGSDPSDTTALILDFSASFLDAVGATYTGAAGQQPYSIAINFSNNLSGESGFLNYSYTATL